MRGNFCPDELSLLGQLEVGPNDVQALHYLVARHLDIVQVWSLTY